MRRYCLLFLFSLSFLLHGNEWDGFRYSFSVRDISTYNLWIPTGARIDWEIVPIEWFHKQDLSFVFQTNFAVFEGNTLYRYSSGYPVLPEHETELTKDFSYRNSHASVFLGLKKQLLQERNLSFSTYYQLSLDSTSNPESFPATYFMNSLFVDLGIYLEHSFLFQMDYYRIKRNHYNVNDGMTLHLYTQLVPSVLNTNNFNAHREGLESEYRRFGVQQELYAPIYSLDSQTEFNMFSVYWANRFLADAILPNRGEDGRPLGVPSKASQYFGVTQKVAGLGGAVRGFEKSSYDSLIKMANNMELRFLGPAFFKPSIYPFLYFFWDIGYFNSFYTGYDRPIMAWSGVLSSNGLSLGLSFFDIMEVSYSLAYLHTGESIQGRLRDTKWRHFFSLTGNAR